MPSPDQIAAIAALAKLGQSEQQIATTVGLEIGDVATVLAGDDFSNPYTPGSGGRFAEIWLVIVSSFEGSAPSLAVPNATGLGSADNRRGQTLSVPAVVLPASGAFYIKAHSPFELTLNYVELTVWNSDFTETLIISSVNPIVIPGDDSRVNLRPADFTGGNFWQNGADLTGPDVSGTVGVFSTAGGSYAAQLAVFAAN